MRKQAVILNKFTGMALVVTALLLFLTIDLWTIGRFTLSFDVKQNTDVAYQVFYTSDGTHKFNANEQQTKITSKSDTHVDINLSQTC